jgi:hypothetical protein
MQGAVDCYARRQLGPRAVGQIRLSEAELRSLIREEWETAEEYGAVPTKTLHVLLVFDPAMQTRIRTLWESAVITRRLEYAATGLTSGLLLLGILFACTKLDHTTAGAYRIRLVLAGLFLTGALAAGTTAAVALLRSPPAEAAAAEAASARTISVELTDDAGGEASASARQATVAANATSLLVWLGAAVGLAGVLLLFSVGKKPAMPDALKETAVHEAAVRCEPARYEPIRRGGRWIWIWPLLVLIALLLASAVALRSTTTTVRPEYIPEPAINTYPRPQPVYRAPQSAPANSDTYYQE